MKVGLVSDTHVPARLRDLPVSLLSILSDVDLILHAGDLESLHVLQKLEEICPVKAVRGNCDGAKLASMLPCKHLIDAGGVTVGLIHGNQSPAIESRYRGPGKDYDSPEIEYLFDYLIDQLPGADVIVFGHMHVAVVKQWKGRLLVNPGSVVPCDGLSSCGVLTVESKKPHVEIISLS